MLNRDLLASKWQEVVANHSFPHKLFEHQEDAMSLLLGGRHVLLGT